MRMSTLSSADVVFIPSIKLNLQPCEISCVQGNTSRIGDDDDDA